MNTLDKNLIELKDILAQFSPKIRQFIESNILKSSIYELFPYSNPKYDSELSLEEIKESTNNLNTRLSNLKKINKSLNTFQENNTSLNKKVQIMGFLQTHIVIIEHYLNL